MRHDVLTKQDLKDLHRQYMALKAWAALHGIPVKTKAQKQQLYQQIARHRIERILYPDQKA